MIIKVCGMRESRNISDVIAAGANCIGMIFYPKSPRYVTAVPETAENIRRVGVFVNADTAEITDKIVRYRLDMVQLHGSEAPDTLRALRSAAPGVKLIKAISIGNAEDIAQYRQYEDCADLLLFDTKCAGMGGSGKHFDWSVLSRYHGTTPFLLSGGIGPGDAGRIAAFSHPMLAGIDLNSRFETAPAVKDAALLRKFIDEVRKIKGVKGS